MSFSTRLSAPRAATRAIKASWFNSIKKFLEIKIDHDAVAFGNIGLRLCHRLMRRASRPEAVAVLGECRVPTLLQDLRQRLLDESNPINKAPWKAPDPLLVGLGSSPPVRAGCGLLIGSAERRDQCLANAHAGSSRHRRWSFHRRPEPLCCLARAATHARGSLVRTPSPSDASLQPGFRAPFPPSTGSAPASPTSEASPCSLDVRVGWCRIFCRVPLMRCRSLLAAPSRSGL